MHQVYGRAQALTLRQPLSSLFLLPGPIVRINPDELHIKDSEYYDTIYAGAAHKRDRYQKWQMMAGAPNSAFSTTEHDLHRSRRAALSPFFAKRSVVRLEPRFTEKVKTLCARLVEASQEGMVLELGTVFIALTQDVISEYSFGKSNDYLLEPDFKKVWKDTIQELAEGGALRRSLPQWLVRSVQLLPSKLLAKFLPHLEMLAAWEKDVYRQVETVVSRRGSEKTPDTTEEKDSIFKDLRDSPILPPSEKSVQRLAEEGQVLVGAWGETTATALKITSFYVLNTPGVLPTLREELQTVMRDSTDIPPWTVLEELPYLTGVVMEGLRLSFGLTTRIPRVPHEALVFGDWTIPPKTVVSSTTYFVSTDPAIFPDPFAFKPERWTHKDDYRRLNRYLTNFCKGTRACLGINLAYAELYLTIAAVFRRFELELLETSIKDVQFVRDAFFPAPRMDSKGVRIVVKGEF